MMTGGITPQYIDDALVEGNTVDRAATRRLGAYNSLVQYNYSDSNAGGFFMCLIDANNTTLRYNVSRRDYYRPFSIWSGCYNLRGYNNTIWGTADTVRRNNPDGSTFQQPIEAFVRSTAPDGNLLYNNIFYNPGRGSYRCTSCDAYEATTQYSHNLYWDATGAPLKPANDPAAVVANPQLAAPGQGLPDGKVSRAALLSVLGGYAPASSSAARNAGVSVSTAPAGDARGTAVPPGAPDLGAIQHPVAQTASTTLGTSAGAVQNVVDGNLGTSWTSANNPALPGNVEVRFSEPRAIDGVHLAVAAGQSQGATSVDLQTLSGTTWTTRVSNRALTWRLNTSTLEWLRIALPVAVTADGVRLVIRSANLTSAHTAISELRATLGRAAAATTDDYAGTSAQNAVDGVSTSAWGSADASTGVGVQVDPGAPQTVSAVTLSTVVTSGPRESIDSHHVVWAAEHARRTATVVEMGRGISA
jgi:hypothetical protein